MPLPIYIVDAFTNRRFSGNPAAVCVLEGEQDSEWMQSIASEMNLSETAFVRKDHDSFQLRWFTPTTEVPLCGHATLAAAHILWEFEYLPIGMPATFKTLSGKLTATKTAAWINLDFPSIAVEESQAPKSLLDALGVKPIFSAKSRLDYLLELATEDEVRSAVPDFALLAKETAARATIITARSLSVEFDFISRFFAPSLGVNEDPVTGSAHCCLTPYWGRKLGRNELSAYQASKRGGVVRVALRGSRVELSGQAVTVSVGHLT